jgi:adenylosuccinate lyase
MAILPIDTCRYGTKEMKKIFEEESKLQRMLDVEAALAWAHAEAGNIPTRDAQEITSKASTQYVTLERVKAIEREIRHDVASMVIALAEQSGPHGAYVHFGATSYDIVDTAEALMLKDAVKLIGNKLDDLEKTLLEKARTYSQTIMIGRTHGQHALPTTLGFKFAVWMRENARHIQRLEQCSERLLVGKMSGAVGTQAGLGKHAMKIQALVMEKLGVKHADISTQIVQRDRHAELVCLLALIGSSLDNIATEIRELQRPEIGELFEAFERKKQVGSSAMPQKQNPETCERICGLAKVLRGLVAPSLENVVTWHERDLTQSSAERFVIPEACILTDYMLGLMIDVLTNLIVDEQRMKQNLSVTRGRMMAEAVMTALVKHGMPRQAAHELLRKLTIESKRKNHHFKEALIEDTEVRRFLREEEIGHALDPQGYLGTAAEQVALMVTKTEKERRARRQT